MPEFPSPTEAISTESSDLQATNSAAINRTSSPWLDSDLSQLNKFEPYDWDPGEVEAGSPVVYDPEQGFVVLLE